MHYYSSRLILQSCSCVVSSVLADRLTNLALMQAIWCRAEPLTYGNRCCLQVDSDRIEQKSQSPCWCLSVGVVGTPTPVPTFTLELGPGTSENLLALLFPFVPSELLWDFSWCCYVQAYISKAENHPLNISLLSGEHTLVIRMKYSKGGTQKLIINNLIVKQHIHIQPSRNCLPEQKIDGGFQTMKENSRLVPLKSSATALFCQSFQIQPNRDLFSLK